MNRSEFIQEIESVYSGVPREDGIGIYEAVAIK
jgi:hypothetical protein